jgi:hypothetical protein
MFKRPHLYFRELLAGGLGLGREEAHVKSKVFVFVKVGETVKFYIDIVLSLYKNI